MPPSSAVRVQLGRRSCSDICYSASAAALAQHPSLLGRVSVSADLGLRGCGPMPLGAGALFLFELAAPSGHALPNFKGQLPILLT